MSFAAFDSKIFYWGCIKSILPPAAAKFSLDGDIFFLISQSEIRKKMSPSKFNLARSAEKRLFTQPLPNKILRGEAADTPGK